MSAAPTNLEPGRALAEFDRLLRAAADAQADLAALLHEVAATPGPSDREDEIAGLIARRDEALRLWGRAALRVVCAGGDVVARLPALDAAWEGAADGGRAGGPTVSTGEGDGTVGTAAADAPGPRVAAEPEDGRVAGVPPAGAAALPDPLPGDAGAVALAAGVDGGAASDVVGMAPDAGPSPSGAVGLPGGVDAAPPGADDLPAGAAGPPTPAPEPPDIERLLAAEIVPAWARQPGDGGDAQPSADPQWLPALVALLRAMGPPVRVADPTGAQREVDALVRAVSGCEDWDVFPADIQKALVGLAACRARHLQDETEGVELDRAAVDTCFGLLTRFSAIQRPGFVVGLMRSHSPPLGDWVGSAASWWEILGATLPAGEVPSGVRRNPERALARLGEILAADPTDEAVEAAVAEALDADVGATDPRLVRVATPWYEVLKRKARFKALRKAIKSSLDEADAEARQDAGPLPPDWPMAHLTRGRTAVVVGGDLREDARQRLQEAFGFASLEWHRPRTRGDQSLAERVQGGGLGMVILLHRFIGHDVSDRLVAACKATGTPWAGVDRGYGVGAVRAAIERYRAADAQQ